MALVTYTSNVQNDVGNDFGFNSSNSIGEFYGSCHLGALAIAEPVLVA